MATATATGVVAYVYNGLKDFTGDRALLFDGKRYEFEFNSVTRITEQHFNAPDLYRRHRVGADADDKKAIHEYHLDAVSFCHMLFNRHYTNFEAAGILVLDRQPAPPEMAKAKQDAERWWRAQIDEFLAERAEKAMGGKGRLRPDEEIIEKMKEFGIHDPILNPIKPLGDEQMEKYAAMSAANTAAAVDRILNAKK